MFLSKSTSIFFELLSKTLPRRGKKQNGVQKALNELSLVSRLDPRLQNMHLSQKRKIVTNPKIEK